MSSLTSSRADKLADKGVLKGYYYFYFYLGEGKEEKKKAMVQHS